MSAIVTEAPMVQLPMRRVERSAGRLIESLAIFALFGTAFGAFGAWLVLDHHIVTFSSLERLTNAYLVWHNDPPKLAAVGFALPPLQTIALLPFTLVGSMAQSLVALPVCSGLFGGLAMVALNRLLGRCHLPPVLRYVVLVLLALTPTFCFYASAGGSETITFALLTAALGTLLAWYMTLDTRYVIGSGVVFSLAVMADYTMFAWMAFAAVMVAMVLSRRRASEQEIEGSVIAFATPSAYAFALWCLCNLTIVKSPFGWISGQTSVSVNASGASGAGITVIHALTGSLSLAWASAPLLLVVGPALLLFAVARRDEFAAWLAGFALLALLTPGATALLHDTPSSLLLSSGMPMLLVAIVGAAWLYQSLPEVRTLIGAGLVVGLIVSLGIVWNATASYPHQDLEQAFRQTVSGQRVNISRGGLAVGVSDEQSMADYIERHVNRPKSILTDNAQTYAVILFSGRPDLFRTRLDHGTDAWVREVRHPSAAVRYMLIAQHDSGDVLGDTYSGAAAGRRIGLTVVFSNARYALLAVAHGTNVSSGQTSAAASGGSVLTITGGDG